MDFIKGFDRNQLVMMDFEANVAPDSWARVVDWFVDALPPMKELGFNDVLHTEGRPPYKASDLLKLFMYGYKNDLRSSRKLESACKTNIEVIWLIKGLQPSARKIAYFRKKNPKAFKQSFRYFVMMLKEMSLISGETIAIDSFKIRAQNSLKNNFNQKKIERHLEYIDGKIAEYEDKLDEEDLDNDSKQQIEDKIKWQQKNKDYYKSVEKELEESGESQISKTDPDAKSVILHRNVVNVGYNVQAGCDGKYKLFINNDTGKVNDTHALADMALDAKSLLGVEEMNCLTDKGYTTGVHIDTCSKNDITTYSSPKAHSSQDNGLYNMNEFVYDAQNDTYTCPADQVLHTNGNICKKRKHRVKRYYTKGCNGCSLRDNCTKNKMGRYIERSIYQEALEENEKRVNQNPEYYRLRQQITEHQFGTLKRQWGFTFTLMKGKENVLTEVNLIMICYNLKRLMSILGVNNLKYWLNSLYSNIKRTSEPFKLDLSTLFYLKKETNTKAWSFLRPLYISI